jgi:hypothetical protein
MTCRPFKSVDGTIWGFECSRGSRKTEPACSVKEGDKRCERPGRNRCGHPIKPRMRGGKLQTTCDRLLCDKHSTAAMGTWVCPFHEGMTR